MILNTDRARVIALRWKYLIVPAALIAIVAWLLLPARLTKQGLAQKAHSGDIDELAAKYMGDSKNFDDLVEMALTNPDPEMRQKAILRLHILEGDGSTSALFKLYNQSNDPIIKGMVIHSLRSRKASEQLAMIAHVEQEPEFRQMAEAHLKEKIEEMVIDAANCTKCHVSDKTAFTLKMIGDKELNALKSRGNHANLVKYVSWLNGPPPSPPPQNLAPDPWALVVKIPLDGDGYKLNAMECPSLEDLSQKLHNALNGRPADKKTVFVIAPETIAEGEVAKVVNVIVTAGGAPNLLRSPWGLVVTIPQGGGSYKLNAIDFPSLEDLSQRLYNVLNGRPADKKTVFVKAPETIADEEVVKVFNAITAAGGLPMRSPK